jgi:hypothetical protein
MCGKSARQHIISALPPVPSWQRQSRTLGPPCHCLFSATWASAYTAGRYFWEGKWKICTTRNAVLSPLSFLTQLTHGNLCSEHGNPNSKMTLFCTIEYGSTDRERKCGRTAVAECGDCGAAVCSSCCRECCGKAFCGYCYDYHAIHTCLRGSAPTKLRPVPIAFHPAPHRDAL